MCSSEHGLRTKRFEFNISNIEKPREVGGRTAEEAEGGGQQIEFRNSSSRDFAATSVKYSWKILESLMYVIGAGYCTTAAGMSYEIPRVAMRSAGKQRLERSMKSRDT